MKKHTVSSLFPILLLLMGISFYSCNNSPSGKKEQSSVQQEYPLTLVPDTLGDTLRWHAEMNDGKGFTILEDKSMGYSISNILIFPEGFGNHDTILVEASDPVETVYVTDLDGDGKEELFLVTRSAGSGGYAGVLGYSSRKDTRPEKITIQDLPGSSKVPDKIRKGLRGHEEIVFKDKAMIISFPLYLEGDSNAEPSGGDASVTFQLANVNGSLQMQITGSESK